MVDAKPITIMLYRLNRLTANRPTVDEVRMEGFHIYLNVQLPVRRQCVSLFLNTVHSLDLVWEGDFVDVVTEIGIKRDLVFVIQVNEHQACGDFTLNAHQIEF